MNKIKAFREKYKLTQKQFGKLIEKSERQITRLENGHSNITKDILFRLKILKNQLKQENQLINVRRK